MLSMAVPFLGSCDQIKTLGTKLSELEEKSEKAAKSSDALGLNDLLDEDLLEKAYIGSAVSNIGEADFQEFISEPGRLNIVDFHASWCPPCKTLGPVLEQVVMNDAMKVRLGKIDVDQAKELAGRQGVSGIPDVRFYIDGKMVGRFVGGRSKATVEQMVKKYSADIIPVDDFKTRLDAGKKEGKSNAGAATATPFDQAITPAEKDWLPPGVSRQ